jgi:cell division protease FtsH
VTSAPSFKTPSDRNTFEPNGTPAYLSVDPQTAGEAATELGMPDIDSTTPLGGESEVRKDDVPGKKTPRTRSKDHDARTTIIASAVEAATTAAVRRRLYGTKPIVVVVQVPSTSWVKPLEDFLQTVAEVEFSTFARTGSIRTRDKPGVNNDEVAQEISRGRRVVGIAVDPAAILPSTLLAAADLTIELEHPNAAVICAAIRRCLHGRMPKNVDDEIAAGLSLDDIVACMRFGSTPAQAVERLRSAAARIAGNNVSSGAVPLLETAVEYGDARLWGLSLARDIKDYRAGKIPWSQCPKGVVFYSEPGCGKSMLIDSIARHANIPVVRASVGELFANNSGDLGAVIKAQREVFARAAALASRKSGRPGSGCVLLALDECDAVPNRESLKGSHGESWWLPVITDLLLLLDAAISGGQRTGIIVVGLTNRIQGVDAALLRPGRLEQSIEIVRPGLAGVINIIRFHLGTSLSGTDITDVARLAEGSTPAEIMAIVRAARRTARHAERDLRLEDLHEQAAGTEVIPPDMLRRFSVHEAAHAVSVVALRAGKLDHVVLRSRGRSGGQAKVVPNDDDLPTLDAVESRVISILAAGVAEELIIGDVSTGSGGSDRSDMATASAMISVVHASTNLTGNLFFHGNDEEAVEKVRADPRLRRAVHRHLAKLEEWARDLVRRRRDAIVAVADELSARRYLTGNDVTAIMAASDARKSASMPETTPSTP